VNLAVEYIGSDQNRSSHMVVFINSQAWLWHCIMPIHNLLHRVWRKHVWLQRMVDSATVPSSSGLAKIRVDAPPGEHFVAARLREGDDKRKGRRVRTQGYLRVQLEGWALSRIWEPPPAPIFVAPARAFVDWLRAL
jgi:hypothetical protein